MVVWCATSPVYCMYLTLGNFHVLKIMNLTSNCRYPLWFPLLCRKSVWLSWSLSSLEWKPTASITVTFYSQQMLPAIKHVASDMFVFQQDNAASHRARTSLNSYSKKHWTSLVLIMVALYDRADHYIFALWFLSFFFFLLFFSSPNLSGRRLDVYHTSTHGVALVWI